MLAIERELFGTARLVRTWGMIATSHAAPVADLVITAEAVIENAPKKDPAGPSQAVGWVAWTYSAFANSVPHTTAEWAAL